MVPEFKKQERNINYMNVDALMELEQDIVKAKFMADILFSETAEDTERGLCREEHERLANISSILIDYLAAAKQEITRLEAELYGKD